MNISALVLSIFMSITQQPDEWNDTYKMQASNEQCQMQSLEHKSGKMKLSMTTTDYGDNNFVYLRGTFHGKWKTIELNEEEQAKLFTQFVCKPNIDPITQAYEF
ncbi:hypothetical protein [Vibrio fortis]|uniref:hypothetical protein n=1 Tax=Vibrio fortis TaxID=212667 RepID=UPI0038CD9B93